MQPTILQVNMLLSDQATSGAGTIVPAVIGSGGAGNTPFSYNLPAGKKLFWKLEGEFTLGATGGFRFLANNLGNENIYNAVYQIVETVTPTTYNANQTAEAAFANAAAVAGTYSIKAFGSVRNDSTAAGVFSLQFAQNTADVLPITLKAGMHFSLYIE